jgi:DNA-directed RNA polymerase specialized sigma subunit
LPVEEVVAATTYTVRAKRWSGGWELHIEEVGVTQVRGLARAEQQVRDCVETLLDIDVGDGEVIVVPELGGLEERVRTARERTKAAEAAQRAAAQEARAVARQLREEGLSVTDVAAVLGVSRGRISQLAS